MVRLWLWILIAATATLVGAQGQVTVEGKLKGYFLAPDGTLKVREVPFSFPEKPSSSELPDHLFPLWAGYYLQEEMTGRLLKINDVWTAGLRYFPSFKVATWVNYPSVSEMIPLSTTSVSL